MGAYQGYIIITIYDHACVDFLDSNSVPKGSQGFLKMHEYGPYDLQTREGLERFLCGVVVLMENDAL